MLKQSDYILSIQEKYYQTSKQLVHLISHLKDQENEIEALKSKQGGVNGLSINGQAVQELPKDSEPGKYYTRRKSAMSDRSPKEGSRSPISNKSFQSDKGEVIKTKITLPKAKQNSPKTLTISPKSI